MATLKIICEAVAALKDRTGSSVPAINKWIEAEKKTEIKKHVMKAALKKGVEDGTLVQVKSSYKLSPTAKAASKKKPAKKPAAKKPAAKKTAAKKTATKKTTTKKTTTTKKKTATKAKKPVAKKAAPKKKTTTVKKVKATTADKK